MLLPYITGVVLSLAALSRAIPITDTLDLGISLSERSALTKRTELVYVGFDDKKPEDKKHKAQLQKAWQRSIELMSYQNTAGYKNDIFKHYFDPAAADDVKRVFDNMWGGNDEKGSINLGSIIVDNEDFGNQCVANNNRLCYTRNEFRNGVLNNARIHCCMKERTNQMPEIDNMKCENLNNMVTYKMLTLSGALLHEYTHFDQIGAAGLTTKQHIRDMRATDPNEPEGYGPYYTRALDKGLAYVNADSYTWLALENFWTIICGRGFTGPRKASDVAAPSYCGGGNSCVIQ